MSEQNRKQNCQILLYEEFELKKERNATHLLKDAADRTIVMNTPNGLA